CIFQDDFFKSLDRSSNIGHLLPLHLGNAKLSRLPLLWLGGQLQLLAVYFQEFRPTFRLLVQPFQRAERLSVLRVVIVDSTILSERVLDLLQLFGKDTTEPKAQRYLSIGISRVSGRILIGG